MLTLGKPKKLDPDSYSPKAFAIREWTWWLKNAADTSYFTGHGYRDGRCEDPNKRTRKRWRKLNRQAERARVAAQKYRLHRVSVAIAKDRLLDAVECGIPLTELKQLNPSILVDPYVFQEAVADLERSELLAGLPESMQGVTHPLGDPTFVLQRAVTAYGDNKHGSITFDVPYATMGDYPEDLEQLLSNNKKTQ